MKRIQYHRYGGPEELLLEEFNTGQPGPNQILVAIRAASVNPVDWKVRSGKLRLITGRHFPRAMGCDFAGVVEAVGLGVTRFKAGDAVLGSMDVRNGGAFAEKLVAPEDRTVLKPPGLSFEQAASLPIVCATAWCGLVDKARLKAGQSVFVHGCLGGVGRAAVQTALMLGAEVAGSCRGSTLEEARALGVTPVFDYRGLDTAALKNRFDVVFDTAGTLALRGGALMLKPGGVVLEINPSMINLLGILLSPRHKLVFANPSLGVLTKIADAAAAGKLVQPIGATVPLAVAIPALAELERSGVPKGKLVIVMGGQ